MVAGSTKGIRSRSQAAWLEAMLSPKRGNLSKSPRVLRARAINHNHYDMLLCKLAEAIITDKPWLIGEAIRTDDPRAGTWARDEHRLRRFPVHRHAGAGVVCLSGVSSSAHFTSASLCQSGDAEARFQIESVRAAVHEGDQGILGRSWLRVAGCGRRRCRLRCSRRDPSR